MRRKRLKAPASLVGEAAYYHCISRVVNRDFVLGDEEREQFVRFMRLYERFCRVRVVTYCIMSNHFHMLVAVPPKPKVLPDNAELIATVQASLGEVEALHLEHDLELAAKSGSPTWEEEIRERYLRRMWDISLFMKTLKQRFSQWFNKRHQRQGTLWEDRFRSVLVQAAGEPLAAMAAYIELNPVRAEMVDDPKDYRWCGYGAAMGGDPHAMAGLQEIDHVRHAGSVSPVASAPPRQTLDQKRTTPPPQEPMAVLESYRVLLYGRGVERGDGRRRPALRKGFSRHQAAIVVAQGGRLPRLDYLRCRVRYFTDGAVLGSRDFVNEVFSALRERFSAKRQSGARLVRGLAAQADEKLFALRDLRRAPVS